MNNKIMISIVVATFALGTIGCGSSGSKKVKLDDNKTPPSAKKVVDRKIKSEFVMPNAGDLDIRDYGKGISVSKDANDYFITYKHNDKGKRVSYYIDTDNNSSSGIDGFELLITSLQEKDVNSWKVNKELKRVGLNDDNQTDWVSDNNISNIISLNTGATKDSLKLQNLIYDDYFTVAAEVGDKQWTAVENLSKRITFDLNLYRSNPTVINGDGSLSIEVDNNATNISISLYGNQYTEYTKILIDADDSNNTGESFTHWNNNKIGADYYIQNNSLFKYIDHAWQWQENVPYVKKANEIKYNFVGSNLNTPGNKVKIAAVIYADSNWYPISLGIPDKNASVDNNLYTFK